MIHSYTLELGYHDYTPDCSASPVAFSMAVYRVIGASVLACLLDLFDRHPTPLSCKSEFTNLQEIRLFIANNIKREHKRIEKHIESKASNINDIIEEKYYMQIKGDMKPASKQPAQPFVAKIGFHSNFKGRSEKKIYSNTELKNSVIREPSKASILIAKFTKRASGNRQQLGPQYLVKDDEVIETVTAATGSNKPAALKRAGNEKLQFSLASPSLPGLDQGSWFDNGLFHVKERAEKFDPKKFSESSSHPQRFAREATIRKKTVTVNADSLQMKFIQNVDLF
jgi:hypothetical protein